MAKQAVGEEDGKGAEEGRHFPGRTGAEQVVGNHHPIFLDIPYGQERAPPSVPKLQVTGLSEEDRDDRNATAGEELVRRNPAIVYLLVLGNVTKAHEAVFKALQSGVHDLYT